MLPDQLLAFGGTTEPAAHIEVLDIGPLEVSNKEFSATIFKFIQEKLGIPDTRLVIASPSLLHSYYVAKCLFSQSCPTFLYYHLGPF